jgi:hypothetical protein
MFGLGGSKVPLNIGTRIQTLYARRGITICVRYEQPRVVVGSECR